MKCRVCGCTDLEPCISGGDETCAWIDTDLCDFCAETEELAAAPGQAIRPLVEVFTEGDLNQVIAARRLL